LVIGIGGWDVVIGGQLHNKLRHRAVASDLLMIMTVANSVAELGRLSPIESAAYDRPAS
jgi:hypothetical protein